MSNVDLGLGIGLLALGLILANFAIEGFRMWRADRRERQWQRELEEMLEREQATVAANQKRIDEAYKHSLPPDPEAVAQAKAMAATEDGRRDILYGWATVRPEMLHRSVDTRLGYPPEWTPEQIAEYEVHTAEALAAVATQRARVERHEQRRKNEEARRQLDAVEFNRTRPSYQHDLFTTVAPDPVQHYSPASASAARDVPFVSSGGGSFDGGGSSGSYGSSCSSPSSSSSSDSGSSSSSSSSSGSD